MLGGVTRGSSGDDVPMDIVCGKAVATRSLNRLITGQECKSIPGDDERTEAVVALVRRRTAVSTYVPLAPFSGASGGCSRELETWL